LNSAARCQADALVLSCPLCDYNLEQEQKELKKRNNSFKGMPAVYFTQLLALAFGLDSQVCHFELNYEDPRSLLESKGLF
jgi:heterodisulfide reductase subunit B